MKRQDCTILRKGPHIAVSDHLPLQDSLWSINLHPIKPRRILFFPPGYKDLNNSLYILIILQLLYSYFIIQLYYYTAILQSLGLGIIQLSSHVYTSST